MTTDQVAERADRLAHLLGERGNKMEMAKAALAHAKSEIKELDAVVGRLGNEVRDKACYAPTNCQRLFDYRRGIVTEIRLDTGEQISERPMTTEERQMSFDAPKKPDDAGGGDGSGGSLDDDFGPDGDA